MAEFRHPALTGTTRFLIIGLGPINPLNGLLSVRSRWCVGHEIMWPRERCLCLEKKIDMKCMQLKALKNIARMTRRLSVFIMSHTHFRVNLHSVIA